VLWEWGLTSLSDPVELIVSELATNALRASAGGADAGDGYPPEGRPQPIGLRLGSDQQQVLVEVWDGSPAPPVAGLVSSGGETGRGLLMVQAMSRQWGYYFPAAGALTPTAVKVVWALVDPGGAG
jgi:two-component sensor histidine kinase